MYTAARSEDRTMNGVLDSVGKAVGTLLGVALFGGMIFVQCVYPFIQDNSESWTCDHERMSSFCDDQGTIAGFAVVLCGSREAVKFTGNLIKTYTLGEGETGPRSMELVIKCSGLNATWETESYNEIKTIDDIPPSNKQAERFMEAFKAFTGRSITLDAARQRVLAKQ
jgi:hypothetical protein